MRRPGRVGAHLLGFRAPRSRFTAERGVFSLTQILPYPPQDVFPLLCHTRELEWLEGWNRDLIYSESGLAENNAVFLTKLGTGETWVTSRYEPASYVLEAVILAGRSMVAKLDISLDDRSDGTCEITWRQTHTALTWAGNLAVRHYSQTRFERQTRRVLENLECFMKTGEKQTAGGSWRSRDGR